MVMAVVISLVTIWAAIALSYSWNWPVGFFVGVLGAASYAIGRGWSARQRSVAATQGV
jgi:zinc/manganese transport system permease protein